MGRVSAAVALDPGASVGAGVRVLGTALVGPGAVLRGPMEAGDGLRVQARALVGGPAQHREGDAGRLVIGRDVHLHECCTVHRGSPAGSGVTRLGDEVRVMAYAHVGHDVDLGDGVTLANGAQLGGHGVVGAGAVVAARAALHQHVRVGAGALVAAGAFVSGDVLPWSVVAGDRARVRGANRVALRRAGFGGSSGAVEELIRRLSPGRGRSGGAVEVAELLGRHPGASAAPLGEILAFAAADRLRPLCPWGKA